MKKIIALIPNTITCGNLLCGCIAIVQALEGNLIWAAYLVGIAAVLDFFDGFAARMLRVYSELGKQLDSLADAVTFGIVPAMVMFKLMQFSIEPNASANLPSSMPVFAQNPVAASLLPYTAFLIAIFSVLRLAKFNIDTRQAESFIGVPTPANAMLICSLPLIIAGNEHVHLLLQQGNFVQASSLTFLLNFKFLLALSVLMSYLLITEIPLFALKFKHFKWKGNEVRYLFLISSLVLLVCFQYASIPFIIILYAAFSLLNNLLKQKKI